MSYDGPFGTAHERRTPSISRRRSKCKRRAACLWTTNRRPGAADTVPIGSGVVSGDRLARYALRLSTCRSSSLLAVTGMFRLGGEAMESCWARPARTVGQRTLASLHDLDQRPRPP